MAQSITVPFAWHVPSLIDADLGGHVAKKRVALPGRGKGSGSRTLVVYQQGNKAFFVYGFAKMNGRTSVSPPTQ